MDYKHDDTECFCIYCGNNNDFNNEAEMCEYCYDDDSIRYFCYLCSSNYDYAEIDNICITYINASNTIKRLLKLI